MGPESGGRHSRDLSNMPKGPAPREPLLVVGKGGVEPPRPHGHTDLNRARLPFRHFPVANPGYRTQFPGECQAPCESGTFQGANRRRNILRYPWLVTNGIPIRGACEE